MDTMLTQLGNNPVKALTLFSGGLDSQLVVCVLRDQHIDVTGIVFDSPFFVVDPARAAAERLDLPLIVHDFTVDIVSLLDAPPHGFGSGMNPCVDCHATMLHRAGEIMDAHGFHVLCSGEVLGQRPMSQNRRALDIVSEACGYGHRLLRPLSALCLPVSEPEKQGLVDRERLLGIQGRGRKTQLRLARSYGLRDIPTPAGGCRLTEPVFSRRLRDLKEHEGLHGVPSFRLLRVGRHFRLADGIKLIVARNERENMMLQGSAELYDLVLSTEKVPGPTALLPFTAQEEQILQAARICARYSDGKDGQPVEIKIRSARGARRLDAVPAPDEDIEALRV